MLGLLIVGLVGLLVVLVGMPVVLWGLCMETIRDRTTEAQPTPSTRLALVHSSGRLVATPACAAA